MGKFICNPMINRAVMIQEVTVFQRKEMFYLMVHSTHFIYGYMVKDDLHSKRGNPCPPHGLLFLISSKACFICTV